MSTSVDNVDLIAKVEPSIRGSPPGFRIQKTDTVESESKIIECH